MFRALLFKIWLWAKICFSECLAHFKVLERAMQVQDVYSGLQSRVNLDRRIPTIEIAYWS